MKIYRLILLLLLPVIFIRIAAAQQLVDGIAAIVGKEIVLKSEVDQYVQSYAVQNKLNLLNDDEKLKQIQKQVLERLVEQKILLSKAEEDTITADDREVDRRVEEHLKYLIQQVGSEQQLEAAFQNPMKTIRKELRKETVDRLKVEILRSTKFQGVKISRREVENFYKTYKDSLPPLNETVDISHILKQVKAGSSSRTNSLERIALIQQQLAEGADFAELASKYSQDVASAKRGGDLGFTQRGDFVKEFEEVAFALEEGQISEVVESQFGFHIIKLSERRGEKIRTSHILIQPEATSTDEEEVILQLQSMRKMLQEGAVFDSLALKYSDDENVSNDKGHLGLWEVEKLAIAAFKNEIENLKINEISEPFKTEYGYHILKLNDHQPKRELTIEKNWEQIEQVALNFKIEQEYAKWIDGIRKEIPIEYKINF